MMIIPIYSNNNNINSNNSNENNNKNGNYIIVSFTTQNNFEKIKSLWFLKVKN